MALTLTITQEHKLSLQERLEMKEQIVLQLQLQIPAEFEDFITFEDDADVDLLQESFPFLMLHELNHPLHHKGILRIPKLLLPEDVETAVCHYRTFGDVYHHDTELGIDRGAIIVGQQNCGYTRDEMIQSHAAITERVFRDVFDEKNIESNYGFIARLDAALRMHQNMLQRGNLRKRVYTLAERVKEHVQENLCEEHVGIYEGIVKAYSKIYTDTTVNGGKRQQDS